MLNINYRDGRPVYMQIKDELRLLIVTGAVEPGGKMPSVRELAQELAINPNTIQRAGKRGLHLFRTGQGQLCR